MPRRLKKVTNLTLTINIFLFIIKVVIGFISNSIAVISEAVNSLTDIISSIAIKISVKVSGQQPDENHQFGHNAAQPIAAFIVAVFAFVVGIKIIEESVKRIINPAEINTSIIVYIVLVITMITKIFLSRYQRNIGNLFESPAIKAAAIDSLNDVLAAGIALAGIIAADAGLNYVDGIAGLFIASFILKTGYEVARENIDYLMGRAADEKTIIEAVNRAIHIKGVEGFNDVRSHFVGDKIHIEFHIEVDKNLTTRQSHDIGKEVQLSIEEMDKVQKVFIHIDPITPERK